MNPENEPALKFVDPDIIQMWRERYGDNTFNWNLTNLLQAQSIRTMGKLIEAMNLAK